MQKMYGVNSNNYEKIRFGILTLKRMKPMRLE